MGPRSLSWNFICFIWCLSMLCYLMNKQQKNKRQALAFSVSHVLGFHRVPVSVIRSNPQTEAGTGGSSGLGAVTQFVDITPWLPHKSGWRTFMQIIKRYDRERYNLILLIRVFIVSSRVVIVTSTLYQYQ